MASAAGWFGVVTSRWFSVFERLPREATLVFWSAACGLLILLVFRYTSRPEAIRRARSRLTGLLLEMWLYGDEPVVVFRAQRSLIVANLRYLALLAPSILTLAAPVVLVGIHLDRLLGRSPLGPGQSAVVTVQFSPTRFAPPDLEVPAGVVVETPSILVAAERQVCWRIRATGEADGNLRILEAGIALDKRVVSAAGPRYVIDRRGSSVADLILHPGEPALPAGAVEWIEIGYPEARPLLFGTRWPWMAWFFALTSVTALLFAKRFGVAF